MKNKKGFTLIELLVVVLIISILAAIAVPQYQKAVAKSRATQLLIASKALLDANKAYYLQNGVYATRLEDLDINFNNDTGNNLLLDNGTRCSFQGQDNLYCSMSNPNIAIVHNYSGAIDCYSYKTDNYSGDDLCKAITGNNNYWVNCSEEVPCRVYRK